MLLSTARLVSSSVLAGGTLVGNLTLTGDLTVQGNTSAVVDITTTGDVTLGDTTADTITINGTATLGEVVSINRTSNDLLLQTTTSGNIVLSPAGSCFVQLGTVSSGVWQGTAVDGTYVDIEGTEIKSAGEAGNIKFLMEDGDGTCSWQKATAEGTAILSTGETGRIKFLMEDGDGTCSWQPVTGLVTSVSGSTGAVVDGDIDHDSLLNFASNEHFTQANITTTGTVSSGVWQGTAVDGAYVDIEGTEIKSTGEALGGLFLREDGDGTCSWQTPAGITNVVGLVEGTGVLSTGEAGGTKFLREDGDGSSSWQDVYLGLGTNNILTNTKIISENITFAGTENGVSVGEVAIANGYTVSVVNGSRWLVL